MELKKKKKKKSNFSGNIRQMRCRTSGNQLQNISEGNLGKFVSVRNDDIAIYFATTIYEWCNESWLVIMLRTVYIHRSIETVYCDDG